MAAAAGVASSAPADTIFAGVNSQNHQKNIRIVGMLHNTCTRRCIILPLKCYEPSHLWKEIMLFTWVIYKHKYADGMSLVVTNKILAFDHKRTLFGYAFMHRTVSCGKKEEDSASVGV